MNVSHSVDFSNKKVNELPLIFCIVKLFEVLLWKKKAHFHPECIPPPHDFVYINKIQKIQKILGSLSESSSKATLYLSINVSGPDLNAFSTYHYFQNFVVVFDVYM